MPPLAGIAASAAAGAAADALISRGVRVPVVRKLVQGVAFLVPTALLLAACTPAIADDSGLTVAAITVALGLSSFSLAGLFCTHQVRRGRGRGTKGAETSADTVRACVHPFPPPAAAYINRPRNRPPPMPPAATRYLTGHVAQVRAHPAGPDQHHRRRPRLAGRGVRGLPV